MKDGFRVVDADAHVIEPGDLWERYIAPEYRDRARATSTSRSASSPTA